MAKLTKRVVDATKPAERDVFEWCDALPGFGIRVYPSGTKVYLYQYKRDGRTRRLALGRHGSMTTEEARNRAAKAAGAVRDGHDPAEERDARKADLTVAELCERWIAAGCPRAKPSRQGGAKLKDSTAADYRSAIKRHILPLLGQRKLGSLKPSDISRCQADVMTGKTARTEKTGPRGKARVRGGSGIAGRCTAYLASILTWGVSQGYLKESPAAGVSLIPSAKHERHLSRDDLSRLGATLAVMEEEGLNPLYPAAIRLLALTGCRKSEIMSLRWDYLDEEVGCLRLPDSKTGAKIVPLSTGAQAELARLPRTSTWVFPASRGEGHAQGLQRIWEKVRARAGLDGATLHSLRHGFATTAVSGGASLYLTGKLLGHSQARTTERYAHVALDPLTAVAEATSKEIEAAMDAGVEEHRSRTKDEAA